MEIVEMYARDSGNKIKYWSIQVEQQTHDESFIIIKHGQLGGKLQTKVDPIIEGKNIGKANETTPHQQAESEAKSRVELQRKKGYKTLDDLGVGVDVPDSSFKYSIGEDGSDSLQMLLNAILPKSNTDANDNLIPMKCQGYYKDDEKTKVRIKFPCGGQPKVNGVRAFIKWKDGKAIIFSKKGLEYSILEHITNEFKEEDFEHDGLELIYDGELYIPKTILTDITSSVRTRNLGTQAVKFYTFDLAIPTLSQAQRLAILDDMFDPSKSSLSVAKNIVKVKTVEVYSDSDAQTLTDDWIREGYEGGVFRDFKAEYGFGKRPMTIVKLKRKMSQEFLIVDVIPQEKRPDLALFVCMSKGGKFETNPEGSTELRRQYLRDRDKLIGKMATVEFFEYSVNNKPFHTTMVAIRDYE